MRRALFFNIWQRRTLPLTLLFVAAALFLPAASLVAAPQQAQDDQPSELPVFEFHSGFWINLHHFLYLQGRLRNATSGRPTLDSPTPPEFAAPAPEKTLLTPEQQKAWNAAVAIYAQNWSSRDLLRNNEMVIINNRLAELENCPDLSGKAPECASELKPDLTEALNEAAPAYRAYWWPQQDRENREWIDKVAPLVRQLGVNLGGQLTDVYQRRWPAGSLRVDVIWYGGPLGSYTSLAPLHISIASHDERNQDLAALEMLYHEASHAIAGGVSEAIARECRGRGIPIPRDLWQALIFYTTNELVRRAQGTSPAGTADGVVLIPPYNPAVDRKRLADRGWSNYQLLLERYWQPYLANQITIESAISRMIAVL